MEKKGFLYLVSNKSYKQINTLNEYNKPSHDSECDVPKSLQFLMEKKTKLIYHSLLANHNAQVRLVFVITSGTNFNLSNIRTVERPLHLIPSHSFPKV